jgi:hypothetical protein
MDVAKMVDVFQEKHGITLDPADPVLLLGTLAAELNRESRNEFARIAAQLSEQVTAALMLADTTAKARSERLITEAAKWSAEQIRGAGAEIVEQLDAARENRQTQLNRAGITIGVAVTLLFGATCGFAGWWWRGDRPVLQSADQADDSRVCWMYERLPPKQPAKR